MHGLVTANEEFQNDLCALSAKLQNKGIVVWGVFSVAGKLAVEFGEDQKQSLIETRGVLDLEIQTTCPVG